MNRRGRFVLGAAVVFGVSVLAALLGGMANPGTDDRASAMVESVSGEPYEPWVQPPEVPGGEQNAPLLFGVQAGAGLAVLAGCLWYWRENRSGT